MPNPPLVNLFFDIAAELTPKERVAIALSLLATEAEHNKDNPKLKGMVLTGDKFEDAISFLRAVKLPPPAPIKVEV